MHVECPEIRVEDPGRNTTQQEPAAQVSTRRNDGLKHRRQRVDGGWPEEGTNTDSKEFEGRRVPNRGRAREI